MLQLPSALFQSRFNKIVLGVRNFVHVGHITRLDLVDILVDNVLNVVRGGNFLIVDHAGQDQLFDIVCNILSRISFAPS